MKKTNHRRPRNQASRKSARDAGAKAAAASEISAEELEQFWRDVAELFRGDANWGGAFGLTGSTTVRPAKAPCGPSPTKSGRRTKAEIAAIKTAICQLLEQFRPMTVRQVFYRLVGLNYIAKTEGEYKQTVCRLLKEMRGDGSLPYGWIADNTRWMRKPHTYGSLGAMFESCKQTYRRAIWENQRVYLEVWLEKEALAGVLVDVTARWDVPLMVTRGYPSLTFLYEAGQVMAAKNCPVHLKYFGDHDPSGVGIDAFIDNELRKHAPHCDLNFERVALLEEHIAQLGLPTRPTKPTDSRSKSFTGESVELDAIEPNTLRKMCDQCIAQHVDKHLLDQTLAIEAAERETLDHFMRNFEAD